MSYHRRGFSSPPSLYSSRSYCSSNSSPCLVTPHEEEDSRLEFLYRRPSAIQATQYEVNNTVKATAWCFMVNGLYILPVCWVCRIRCWSSELLSPQRTSSSLSAPACTASWMAWWVLLLLLLVVCYSELRADACSRRHMLIIFCIKAKSWRWLQGADIFFVYWWNVPESYV